MKIEDIPLFYGSDKSFYEKASKHFILKKSSSKSIIFNEYEFLNSGSYILKSGVVSVSKVNKFGNETSVNAVYPGGLFGWSTLIDEGPTSAKVTAVSDCEYWLVPHSFKKDLWENKYFTKNLLKYLMNYIRTLENFTSDTQTANANAKVLTQLLRISVPNSYNQTATLHHSFNQGIISTFAGVSRETVSRVIKELKLKQILKTDDSKNMIINSPLANKFLNEVNVKNG